MSEDLRTAQEATIYEIDLLLTLRKNLDTTTSSPMEYLCALEIVNEEYAGHYFFLEKPFHTFYSIIEPPEVAELYKIYTIKDLTRFELIKMIEHNIFIKKCKNCNRFFIPRRRIDAEYCDSLWNDGSRRCSEIGATLRYEKKVAENPILEAHKKAYRRFHSRTRAKKMTNDEFLAWPEEAKLKRDECLAGVISFDESVEWLELGRIRKSRNLSKITAVDGEK